jgi:predicted ribosome quality control (RQC) complex YloA/Tae2 family protein
VHNSYFLLVQLILSLRRKIIGYRIVSVFSQEKDELIIEFNNGNNSFFIRAGFRPEFPILIFPASFGRARKNSVDLFPELIMKSVLQIRNFENERAFLIECTDGYGLLFKIHGPSGNVVLFHHDSVKEIFRNSIGDDFKLKLDKLSRSIDWSEEFFLKHIDQIRQYYFTFGKEIWRWLNLNGFDPLQPVKSWTLIKRVLAELALGKFYLIRTSGSIEFSLLKSENIEIEFNEPEEALNYFYGLKIRDHQFQQKKLKLLKDYGGRYSHSADLVEKTEQRLKQIKSEIDFQFYADLIMANLNFISSGMEKVELENFYNPGQKISVRLNPLLSAQKNAEVYYRKSKNRQIEIARLQQILDTRFPEMQQLKEKIDLISGSTEPSQIAEFSADYPSKADPSVSQKRLPYQEVDFMGYRILIGKSASDNDELTLKHSFKDDLWLHAKDVAGSHVLIKFRAGLNFPRPVIERAAQLAAYYSKRKGETLCPVCYTPKKYVRKRKGDPSGTVVVERESVILVEPKG